MNIGFISSADVGNWYLGSDGTILQLKNCYGMLLYCWTPQGNMYYPAHDALRQLSPQDAGRRLSKLHKLNSFNHEQPRNSSRI